ncbi:Protein-tyrosine phosphatase, low molecular weight [Dethiosulfovibrio peptidovorans DSM 11002]|uniref:Protein-tyrosine phosphatase, low molecular weight n=1 Tax=Dethiosulfovibrio peptidovorans DSM 11002 TaxID=469381 RepID=D2Z742_9BACT|nr:arsenate reductase ArsC [Dethiosulfovibrio peptidovorans]EFC91289.1 Protein-tyrosine phosphatase, low molecular weight [Dethiosulfovibrio peptidovorans DSM 11002]
MRILFLCTGNSCRSQMAEGWARHTWGDRYTAFSAGSAPHGLDPLAVRVMAEAGVDISGHRSKSVTEFFDSSIDLVITVCDKARGTCPVFPGDVDTIHAGFEDPPALAREDQSEEEALIFYRRVRDGIKAFVEGLPKFVG